MNLIVAQQIVVLYFLLRIELIVLKQRWALIHFGTSASSIKICDSKSYVDESLYGTANGPIFPTANQTDIRTQSKPPPSSDTLHQRTVPHQPNV